MWAIPRAFLASHYGIGRHLSYSTLLPKRRKRLKQCCADSVYILLRTVSNLSTVFTSYLLPSIQWLHHPPPPSIQLLLSDGKKLIWISQTMPDQKSPSNYKSPHSICACPSWPSSASFSLPSTSSSFLSDEDLLGNKSRPEQAPGPPRQPPMAKALPLPPLYTTGSSKKKRGHRRPKPRFAELLGVISECPNE